MPKLETKNAEISRVRIQKCFSKNSEIWKAETTVMQVSCSYTVNTVHILNIPGFIKCPGAGKKLTVKCPGAGNFFCANARGCPGGGMVRVGIERDIIRGDIL